MTMTKRLLLLLPFVVTLYSCGMLGTGQDGQKNEGKVFRYNQTGGLNSLDPAQARNRASIWATTQLYNGLITLNENLDAEPELAKQYDISQDGLTYTFIIRTGVRFHDNACFPNGRGRELTAHDFVYSFKRILDPKTSTGAWIFKDKVLTDEKGNPVDSCFKAVNDTTLKIYLKERSPVFLQILAMPYAFAVPKEAVEKYGKDFRSNPVGTGPFVLQKWVERQDLILTKNTNYWKKDQAGNAYPYLDAVKVTFIDDPNTAFLQFQEGKLDFLTGISEASKDQILNKDGSLKEQFKGKFEIDKVPYLNTEYVGFLLEGNEKENPFLNLKVRQALSYATNRAALVYSERNGLGRPGDYGFVPRGLPSFDTVTVKGYPFNLKRAQELLKEAGYPNGEGFPVITLYTYPSDKKLAEVLQTRWKQLGINVKIETNQFTQHQEMVDKGKVNLFRGSWLGDYPDAENFLRLFYGKEDNFASNGGVNKTHFRNEDYNKLFEKAHQVEDLFERYAIYRQMDSIVMAEAPVIVLYYDEVIRLRQNYVVGLKPNIMNYLSLEKVDFKDPVEAKETKK
ncbi:MAG: peptide ABC transporter substrate-binding protein [Cytophagales bacterium]|nr:MAG: peptide ABC transporter substrate-binding protein [Cytophagales bacterium]